MAIIKRQAVGEDFPFIFATYLRSNWFSPKNDTVLKKDTWMRVQHQRLEELLGRGLATVACLSEDNDVILGYAIADEIPYMYVRPQWRKVAGIEQLLNIGDKQ